MGFNKSTFILDIIDGALFIDPSPTLGNPLFGHPALLMRQNSKGLSHSHSTQPGGRQKLSRKRFTVAAQCKKLLDLLPPSFFLLLHLLLLSILLSFLMLSDDYSKCKSQAHVCVCAHEKLRSHVGVTSSHPLLHSIGSCWLLVLLFCTGYSLLCAWCAP